MQSLFWKIRVTFSGKSLPKTYITPDIRHNNPGWADEAFNRQIESLEFFIPTGHRIVMSGMEQYCFFVEATQSLSGKGNTKIEAFWFCGKHPMKDVVEMWRVEEGKVTRQIKVWGKEWGGSTIRGWKQGEMGNTPISKIVER